MKNEFTSKDMNRISLLIALFVSVDFINFIINEWFETGGMIYNVIILIGVMVIFYKTIVKIQFPAPVLTFVIILSVYYSVTYETQGTTLFGREFIYYFCFAAVLGMYKCDMEHLLRYLSYISLLILPFYTSIFIELNSTRYHTSIELGLSYAMFPLLMSGIFHFFYYREKAGKFQYIIYAISVFLLFQLVMKGTRGVSFSIMFAVAVVFLKGGFKRSALKRKNGISSFRVIFAVIAMLILYVWFYEILGWLQKLIQGLGLDAHFIEKIFTLQESGDVLNGRSDIFDYTYENFLEEPFFGHGLSTIFVNSRYRYIYSHNFLLQLLYDGGLFVAVPVILVIGRALYCVFTEEDENEVAFTLFFMSISLPKALFSGDIWENPIFWVFVFHSMKYHVLKRKMHTRPSFAPVGDDTMSKSKGEKG